MIDFKNGSRMVVTATKDPMRGHDTAWQHKIAVALRRSGKFMTTVQWLRHLIEAKKMATFVFKCPNCGHVEEVPGICGKGPDYEPLCAQCESRPWRAYAMDRLYTTVGINLGESSRYDELTNYQMKNLK
jgi:hypothetical protein